MSAPVIPMAPRVTNITQDDEAFPSVLTTMEEKLWLRIWKLETDAEDHKKSMNFTQFIHQT